MSSQTSSPSKISATSTLPLNSGHSIPLIGIGCWMGRVEGRSKEETNEETYGMVLEALKAGYRHIDTASGYGNEEAVGRAIRDSGIARGEIFLTTKLGFEGHSFPLAALQSSLKALNTPYIDLYLMHWPMGYKPGTDTIAAYGQSPTFVDTWRGMEDLIGEKCRSIGVSNFSVKNLEILLKETKIVPAVNQVESNPYHPQTSLHSYCASHSIHLTAYSPIGQPQPGSGGSAVLRDETVKAIGEKLGVGAGTVLLSWLVQRGNWSVVPKSSNPARIKSNLELIHLSSKDFSAISDLHKQPGKLMISCDYPWGNPMEVENVLGWSLKEMGWEELD